MRRVAQGPLRSAEPENCQIVSYDLAGEASMAYLKQEVEGEMEAPRLSNGGPGLPRKGSPGFRPEGQGAIARRQSPQDSTSPSNAASAVRGGAGTTVKGGDQAR